MFNVGWMLAERGHRVLMVDSDPQCNLTGIVLNFRGAEDFEDFYGSGETIRTGLTPAFEAQPRPIVAVEPVEIPGREGLYLVAGDLRLSEYEVTLGISQELSAAIGALQNLPGSLNFLICRTADAVDADYVLIDMSPGLGAINQNLVAISDFVLVPTAPDFFSVMAIDSLSRILPRWKGWARQAASLPILRNAAYPFPEPTIKFLGTIVQKYRPRGGRPASRFQRWIDELGEIVRQRLVPPLEAADMMLSEPTYRAAGVGEDYTLAQIADFNSLVSIAQEWSTPVFILSDEQLGEVGVVLENMQAQRDSFYDEFSKLAERIEHLVDPPSDIDA